MPNQSATATVEEAADVTEYLAIQDRLAATDAVVRNHAIGAAAIGLIPVPAVDVVGLTALQLNLLRRLSNIYGVPFSEDLGKKAIGSLVAGFAPVVLASPLASLVKLVPVIGTSFGGLAMSAISGASTYSIGKVFVQHFDSGGTFLNFDPSAVRAFYRAQFEQGKQVIKTTGNKSL